MLTHADSFLPDSCWLMLTHADSFLPDSLWLTCPDSLWLHMSHYDLLWLIAFWPVLIFKYLVMVSMSLSQTILAQDNGRGEHHANVSYTTIIPCPIPGHLAHIRTSHNGNLGPVIYAQGTGIGPQGPKTALTPTLYRPATLADPWYAQPPRPVAPARLWGHEPQVARPWRRLPLFSSCPDPASQRERPGGQV